MKQILAIILAMLLLVSCSANQNGKKPTVTNDAAVTSTWNNAFEDTESSTQKLESDKPTLADISLASEYYIDYSFIADGTRLDIEGKMLEAEDSLLKIMAGDLDVDVYFIDATTARLLKEQGIYISITSDKIISFNNNCFDYIRDLTVDCKGNTFLMPVMSYNSAIVYPEKALAEAGISLESLEYYDSFMKTVREYSGNRKKYITGMGFFGVLDNQYQNYYCDFKNKKFDYNTDVYKNIYGFLDGWVANSPNPTPPHFSERSFMSEDYLRADDILFDLQTNYSTYAVGLIENEFNPSDFEYDISEWRAVHQPYISEKVDKNTTNVVFAYINPNSTKIDKAIEALQYIADNPFDAMGSKYSFILKDKSAYPESYRPNSTLFNDFYKIAENGFINEYFVPSVRPDIDDYQAGKTTMDKAIKAYEREVEIWLNE